MSESGGKELQRRAAERSEACGGEPGRSGQTDGCTEEEDLRERAAGQMRAGGGEAVAGLDRHQEDFGSLDTDLLRLLSGSAGPAAPGRRADRLALGLAVRVGGRVLVGGRLVRVLGVGAAGEEATSEAAFVGRVAAALHRNATRPRDVGRFGALVEREQREGVWIRIIYFIVKIK